MRRAAGALLAALALGCGPGADGGPAGEVVARHAHYRITLHATPPASRDAAGEMRLRVDAINGWHISPEAPARLELLGGDALVFEPASLRQEDARDLDEEGFAFVSAVRAEAPGRAVAEGQLKFGICEGPKAKCVVVRRELTLPIDVAFEH